MPSKLFYVVIDVEYESEIPGAELEWHKLMDPSKVTYCGCFSKEEQLLRERKRIGFFGITHFDFSPEKGTFAFTSGKNMYVLSDMTGSGDLSSTPVSPVEVSVDQNLSRIDPKISPLNDQLIAFVCDGDVWVTHYATNNEHRLTFSSQEGLSAGAPCFVIQEEFDRYTGYWWQPAQTGSNTHRILYEVIDESEVMTLKICSQDGQDVEEFPYPRAGTKNAKSKLKIVEFKLLSSGQLYDVENFDLFDTLTNLFPWMEYLVRASWTPDGRYIIATLLDRRQRRIAIVLIPLESFSVKVNGTESSTSDQKTIHVIYEETTDYWLNVHDILYFLNDSRDDYISFVTASERSEYMHLYKITVQLSQLTNESVNQGVVNAKQISLIQITRGDWQIWPKKIWIDESKRLIYFQAFKDTPLEQHLYVARLDCERDCECLTAKEFSHAVELDPLCTSYVTVYSNLNTSPCIEAFKITHSDSRFEIDNIGTVLARTPLPEHYVPPRLYTLRQHDTDIYAMVYSPINREPGKKYPTILYVYGGPQVQMVTNTQRSSRLHRLHMFASVGFAVVVLDCRGSSNRGLKFEKDLLGRLGQIEIQDQVDGLQSLASYYCDFIDIDRVAIHGWSYGGYLSLVGLALRPDVFKLAVVGAPVTAWHLYDTAYTERYMGLPESSKANYEQSSVINMVPKFPDEENRLLIFHGLMDDNVHFQHTVFLIEALNKHCKHYFLQIYPRERHGIRNPEVNEHYETSVLSFLKQHL
ncbi:DgyrCDS9824 [Dimorphilus gyrociliatus]|uniref:DgyrCDS9824 n=1 Tax=Dimorphilus gyrociliatus TaxID=2664684 RepID=A0A7I8VY49_9ANNE|nr:DgyrCDS9824 [Dimorphilus gyrociliatus]